MQYILNHSTSNFGRVSNSIEISLVGRGPGGLLCAIKICPILGGNKRDYSLKQQFKAP